MSIVLDIIAVLFILFFVYRGAKNGLVMTLLQSASFIVTLILAGLLTNPIAGIMTDTALGHSIRDNVAEAITLPLKENPEMLLEDSPIPQVFAKGLAQSEHLSAIADKLAENITFAIFSVILFIMLFILIKFLVKIIIKPVNLLTKFPIVKQVNKYSGAALGFVSGSLWLYIIVACVAFLSFVPIISTLGQEMDKSFIISFLYNHNIILYLLS